MTQFKGSGQWLRLNLKRDRFKIFVWLLFVLGLFLAVAFKFESLYGRPSQIQVMAETLRSPAMTALFGVVPKGTLTTARIFAAEMAVFWAILLIIFNFSLALGASRQSEESGQTELLLGGYAIGRLAPLLAAALELSFVNGLFIIVGGLGLKLAQLPGANGTGDFLLVTSLGCVGWAFGMVALVFAQCVADSHLANMYSYFCFGFFYILRMITDIQEPRYTWLSPLGWVEKTQVYGQNSWLAVGLLLGLGFCAFVGALWLDLKRDLNAGVWQRHRRVVRRRLLLGPATLLWQLQKTQTIVWLLGMIVLGLAYGAVFDSVGQLINTSPVIQKVLGAEGVHQMAQTQLLSYLHILGLIFAILAVVAGLLILNHLLTDQRRGYLELVQTRAVSRSRLYGVYMGYGLLLTAGLLFSALMAAMVAGNLVLAQPLAFHYFGTLFGAMCPIALAFLGLHGFLIGWCPKLAGVAWLYLAVSFMLTYFGQLLALPKWVLKIAPFYSVRQVPAQTNTPLEIGLWFISAAILVILGLVGYRRRDLQIN